MEILTKAELSTRFDEFKEKIEQGKLFIYPIDTIYCLGCDARNNEAVQKVRNLKGAQTTLFSVWVPSLEWVKENCLITPEAEENLGKLPGPYTLILPLQNKEAVSSAVVLNSISIRYPDHWFHKAVSALNYPIIITSANKVGQSFMTDLANLDPEIQAAVEFMIYEGPKEPRPSKVIDLTR